MEKNDLGHVALKYYTTIPHIVEIRQRKYAFVVKANINLAWIEPQDVDTVLHLHRKKECCGGGKTQEYFYANESDVRRWTNNGGR